MRLITQAIPANCDIVIHGDNHEGNVASHRTALRNLIKWIGAKPNRYFIHMGDALEATTVDHKFYTYVSAECPVPMQQRDKIIEMYQPIADRGLVWLKGNHEDRHHRVGDFSKDIATDLKIPYGGMVCKLRLTTTRGNQIFKAYLAHPSRMTLRSNAKDKVQRQANMLASLKNKLERKASDCLVHIVGHIHQLLVLNPNDPNLQELVIYDDGKALKQGYMGAGDGAASYIEPNRRYYGSSGSFLRTQVEGEDTYSEKSNYDPVEIGYLVARVRNGKLKELVKRVV